MQKWRKFFAVSAKGVTGRKTGTKRTDKIFIKCIENTNANKTTVNQYRDYVSSHITKKMVKRSLLLSNLFNLCKIKL